jgi:hypothetical protein
MRTRRIIFHLLPGAAALLLLTPGCAGVGRTQSTTTLGKDFEEQDYAVVEVIEEPELRTSIELPLPPNPYDDAECDLCNCVCAAGPDTSAFEKLIAKLKLDADKRAGAAAEALLESAHEIVGYGEWKEITENTMELLSNPTIVMVPMPGGKLQKVSLEKLPKMDLSAGQIVTIRNSVNGKMRSAIAADMTAHGVPPAEAKKLSAEIMKVYMKSLLAP